jgi:tight adherence protein B
VTGLLPLVAVSAVAALGWVARPLPLRLPSGDAPATTPRSSGRAEMRPPAWFERRAALADLDDVSRWWRLALATPMVMAALGVLVAGPGGAVAAAGASVSAELVALGMAGGRAQARLARSVPDALDAVARSCRAGSSVVVALSTLGPDDGPAAPIFADVAHRVARGVALRDALDDVVAAHPDASVRLAAAALLVGADTGAAPARAVDGVAATLRDRVALEREAAGHATQATASAAVLVLAPVGFGAFAVVTDPRVGGFLFSGPAGWACLSVGIALDVIGALWMARMVKAAR